MAHVLIVSLLVFRALEQDGEQVVLLLVLQHLKSSLQKAHVL
jgi:hypothetical protein